MNILKAADDIKNFSDQQLLSAGENPVMLPPYLVLAEMKRREQMRAEFAKSQQQQQPPTVIQQTAQNLAQSQQQQGQPQQGQPQQGMPQQPQAQGIMQGAPQQVMAMASGGYVPRYAAGTQPDYGRLLAREMNTPPAAPRPPAQAPPSLAMSNEDIAKRYPDKPLAGYIDELRSAYGPRDYSAEKKLVDYQTQMAESKKPSLGNALIAAGGFMAANRDNKVGLANLLAQAIGVGSQSYDAAKDNQNKLRNLAMMGQVALQRQQQKDSDDMIGRAMESKRSDVGVNLGKLQTIEANIRSISEALSRAQSDTDKMMLQRELNRFEAIKSMAVAEANNAADIQRAAMQLSRLNPRQSREDRDDRVQDAVFDATSLATTYQLGPKPVMDKTGKSPMDPHSLAINNLLKTTSEGVPKYFTHLQGADRARAISVIDKQRTSIINQRNKESSTEKNERGANPSGIFSSTGITAEQQLESDIGNFNGKRVK